MKVSLVVGVVAAAVLLGGCSADDAPTPVPAPASSVGSAPASSAAPTVTPSPTASPSATPSATPTPASVQDPCTVITLAEMRKLTGLKLKSAVPTTNAGTKLCSYAPADVSAKAAGSVTVQEGTLPGSLDDALDLLKGQFTNGKVSKTTVSGADQARLLTGTLSGASAVDIIATKDDVYYQTLVVGKGSTKAYVKTANKVTRALIAG